MQEFQENLEGETEGEPVNGVNEMTFTLKRSGKTIRRLSAGNPQLYTLNLLVSLEQSGIYCGNTSYNLNFKDLFENTF